jgi:hypothetical protein
MLKQFSKVISYSKASVDSYESRLDRQEFESLKQGSKAYLINPVRESAFKCVAMCRGQILLSESLSCVPTRCRGVYDFASVLLPIERIGDSFGVLGESKSRSLRSCY